MKALFLTILFCYPEVFYNVNLFSFRYSDYYGFSLNKDFIWENLKIGKFFYPFHLDSMFLWEIKTDTPYSFLFSEKEFGGEARLGFFFQRSVPVLNDAVLKICFEEDNIWDKKYWFFSLNHKNFFVRKFWFYGDYPMQLGKYGLRYKNIEGGILEKLLNEKYSMGFYIGYKFGLIGTFGSYNYFFLMKIPYSVFIGRIDSSYHYFNLTLDTKRIIFKFKNEFFKDSSNVYGAEIRLKKFLDIMDFEIGYVNGEEKEYYAGSKLFVKKFEVSIGGGCLESKWKFLGSFGVKYKFKNKPMEIGFYPKFIFWYDKSWILGGDIYLNLWKVFRVSFKSIGDKYYFIGEVFFKD